MRRRSQLRAQAVTDLRRTGLAIADARVARLWNQSQLAAAVPCSARQVSRWERGEQSIGLAMLARVAAALGVSVASLVEPAADAHSG